MYQRWLEETKTVFFKGAIRGWAGGNNGQCLEAVEGSPGMEEWRQTAWQDPLGFQGYHYSDRWGQDPDSGKPSGQTVIMHWGIPVWVMWCGGESYDKSVLPFLRRVLKTTYDTDLFLGGRGPQYIAEDDLAYVNNFEGDFSRFSGEEHIVNYKGVRLGGHRYWGGSLVFLNKS